MYVTTTTTQCAQHQIESMHRVYQKHFTEETVSKDGRKHTMKHESFVQQENRLMVNSPRRSLAPKSLSYGLKGANNHQAINVNNNIGMELVKPVHNFDADKPVSGVVSTIDESIINSPLLQKNGFEYYHQTITTTTTETVTRTVVRSINTATEDSSILEPIDVGKFLIGIAIVIFEVK